MNHQCKLCLHDAVLRRSHIVPEFVYRPVFGIKRTAIVLEPKKRRLSSRQTGYWDRLFCDGCETRLGRLETYFADVWFKKPLRPHQLQGQEVRIVGLDYARFKLFLLSILWRADLSTLSAFQDVSLGPYSEDLRQRILALDPGPPELYPISGLALRSDEGGFKDGLMLLPVGSRIDGHHVYIMLFGGVFWSCAVSSHHEACPVPANLNDDGTLTLIVQDWTKNSAVLDLARQMKSQLKGGAV